MTANLSVHARKTALRQQMRQRRRALSTQAQRSAERRLASQIARLPGYRAIRHLAAYLATDGEIATTTLLRRATRQRKHCYLPRITGHGAMQFHRYVAGERLFANSWGIAEPGRRRPRRSLHKMDLVLLPLVAFDRHGGRLGMGGGFYDRALAACKGKRRPLLVGLAHDLQEVEQVPGDSWDVQLDWLVTPSRRLRCTGARH